jgi:hypothetical protein
MNFHVCSRMKDDINETGLRLCTRFNFLRTVSICELFWAIFKGVQLTCFALIFLPKYDINNTRFIKFQLKIVYFRQSVLFYE